MSIAEARAPATVSDPALMTLAQAAAAIRTRQLSSVEATKAALARIEDNTYGKCVGCGLDIPEGRLDARPDAARCVGCQAKHARRR